MEAGAGGGARTEAKGGGGRGRGRVASRGCGRRREAPTMPQRGTLRIFWRSRSAGGGSWASRWGLGSENRPSRRCAENMGPPWPGIFRSVSGPNSYGKPPIGRSQGRGGRWPPLRPPLARDPSYTCRQQRVYSQTSWFIWPISQCTICSTQNHHKHTTSRSLTDHERS